MQAALLRGVAVLGSPWLPNHFPWQPKQLTASCTVEIKDQFALLNILVALPNVRLDAAGGL